MKARTRPAPGPGRGHVSPAGKAKRERQFFLDVMHNWDAGGWGGAAEGAQPSKPRTLPQVTFAHPDDLDDIAEREAVARFQNEFFRAKLRALDARRARLARVLRGGDFRRAALSARVHPAVLAWAAEVEEVTRKTPGARTRATS
jgi:hypothetical protein